MVYNTKCLKCQNAQLFLPAAGGRRITDGYNRCSVNIEKMGITQYRNFRPCFDGGDIILATCTSMSFIGILTNSHSVHPTNYTTVPTVFFSQVQNIWRIAHKSAKTRMLRYHVFLLCRETFTRNSFLLPASSVESQTTSAFSLWQKNCSRISSIKTKLYLILFPSCNSRHPVSTTLTMNNKKNAGNLSIDQHHNTAASMQINALQLKRFPNVAQSPPISY